ncbi:PhoP regulatory network protein YrbL [Pectobacterium sp. B1J-3]|uniref:PhoP regulatory network protein YrbL n=1 Tax=Pectobacterium sp. B1J-3 TaxID=3385371 RepID=UPI0039058C4C
MMVLDLSPSLFIGKGRHRKCYQHPNDSSLCVKVVYNPTRGGKKELKRELNYYRHLQKRRIDWRILPSFHGQVDTTQGTGYIFDLIRDYDGSPSKSLNDYLPKDFHDSVNDATLHALLSELKQDLIKNRIITMTLKAQNILYKKESSTTGRLVVVDNIGNAAFFPLANYVDTLSITKIERTWARFIDSLNLTSR